MCTALRTAWVLSAAPLCPSAARGAAAVAGRLASQHRQAHAAHNLRVVKSSQFLITSVAALIAPIAGHRRYRAHCLAAPAAMGAVVHPIIGSESHWRICRCMWLWRGVQLWLDYMAVSALHCEDDCGLESSSAALRKSAAPWWRTLLICEAWVARNVCFSCTAA